MKPNKYKQWFKSTAYSDQDMIDRVNVAMQLLEIDYRFWKLIIDKNNELRIYDQAMKNAMYMYNKEKFKMEMDSTRLE